MDKNKKKGDKEPSTPDTSLPHPEIFPSENPEFPGEPTVPNRAWTQMFSAPLDILTDDEKRNLRGPVVLE